MKTVVSPFTASVHLKLSLYIPGMDGRFVCIDKAADSIFKPTRMIQIAAQPFHTIAELFMSHLPWDEICRPWKPGCFRFTKQPIFPLHSFVQRRSRKGDKAVQVVVGNGKLRGELEN